MNGLRLCLIFGLINLKIISLLAAPLDHDVLDYLENFGYLPKVDSRVGNLMKNHVFSEAIKRLQRNANLPQTGVIDDETKELLKKPRCGVPDEDPYGETRRRRKRFVAHGKWPKIDLSWSFLNMTNLPEGGRIRRLLYDALGTWQKHSTLQFRETADPEADILISFARGDHGDGFNFDGSGKVLAHAFYPGTARGGDVHFDMDEEWDYERDVNRVDKYKTSFFGVALHELGHALGLGHSSVEGSVMFAWYHSDMNDLSEDDIVGINELYKNPNKQWGPISPRPRPTQHPHPTRSTTKHPYSKDVTFHHDTRPTNPPRTRPIIPTTTRAPQKTDSKPDSCNTSYDAITTIRGELFIFKGRYMWRFNRNEQVMAGYPVEINRFWKGLPESFTKVDAVYEDRKSRIIFFIGKHYYVFNSNVASYSGSLTDLGLPERMVRIDAMFKWGHNNRTFIFSGNDYWRYDEEVDRVEEDYPRRIRENWKGVGKPDTVFQWRNGKTYFFEGKVFYQFNDETMTLMRDKPILSSRFWMKCPTTDEDLRTVLVQQRTQRYTDLQHSGTSSLFRINFLIISISTIFHLKRYL